MNPQREMRLDPPCFRWLTVAQLLLGMRLVALCVLSVTAYVTYCVTVRTQVTPMWNEAVVPCWMALGVTLAAYWLTRRVTPTLENQNRASSPSSQVFADAERHLLDGATVVLDARWLESRIHSHRTRRLKNVEVHLSHRGIAVHERGRKHTNHEPELWILWEAVLHVDWTLEEVQLDLMEGRLCIRCAELPPIFGPLDHFPKLRHAVQGATFSLMSFNQSLAALLEAAQTRSVRAQHSPNPSSARCDVQQPPPTDSSNAVEAHWTHDTIESDTVPCAMTPTPAPPTNEVTTAEFSYPNSLW